MSNSVLAILAASGQWEGSRLPKPTWAGLQVSRPSEAPVLITSPGGKAIRRSRIWEGSSTSTPFAAGRRRVISAPVGELVWWLVGSNVKLGPKGKALQPPISVKGAEAVSKRSGSIQLEALTRISSGTPQRVGLVRKGNSREPGGRGGDRCSRRTPRGECSVRCRVLSWPARPTASSRARPGWLLRGRQRLQRRGRSRISERTRKSMRVG